MRGDVTMAIAMDWNGREPARSEGFGLFGPCVSSTRTPETSVDRIMSSGPADTPHAEVNGTAVGSGSAEGWPWIDIRLLGPARQWAFGARPVNAMYEYGSCHDRS